jgi:hypothetical protein
MMKDAFRLKAFAYLEQIGVQFVLSDRVLKVENNKVLPFSFVGWCCFFNSSSPAVCDLLPLRCFYFLHHL